MGTPEFAVPVLKAIERSPHILKAVVTAPDRRGGRGRKKLILSDVKKYALDLDVPILQPRNLKGKAFLRKLKELEADIQVVVAFRMLPRVVWDMPPMGTINLHASLLPDYRGAAPIQWAIVNGETETGLTTFQLKQKVDTGDILLHKKIPILHSDNAGDLHDRLMDAGPDIVLETLQLLEAGRLTATEQSNPARIKSAPKLNEENTRIDFDRPVQQVYDFIRAMSPYPGAWTQLHGKKFKIFQAEIVEDNCIETEEAGSAIAHNGALYVRCQDACLNIMKVQLQGKRRMDIHDFLNGYQEAIKKLGV